MKLKRNHFAFPKRRFGSGFTLVEILIVVVILGILAAIVVPKLSNAAQISREGTLKEDVRFLRTQIAIYSALHNNVNPGYPAGNTASTPTEADTVNQLTEFSDDVGNVSATTSAVFKNGPYLSHMPDNPINTLATITILAAGAALTPDGTTGWLYQPSTGVLKPNLTGNDSTGVSYSSY